MAHSTTQGKAEVPGPLHDYYDDCGDDYCGGCGLRLVLHNASLEVEVAWRGRGHFMINEIHDLDGV